MAEPLGSYEEIKKIAEQYARQQVSGLETHPEVRQADSYVPRGAGVYHPDADRSCTRLSRTFGERLESVSLQISKQDGVSTVDVNHVSRAYDTLVAPKRRRQIGALFGSALFGASLSAIVALFVELATSGGAPDAPILWFLAVAVVVAIFSGIWTAHSAKI